MHPEDNGNRNYDYLDLPWVTESDKSDIENKISFLKSPSRTANRNEASSVVWFQIAVLDKYRNHRYCILDTLNPFSCTIAFLDHDRKHAVASASFQIHHGAVLAMPLDQFIRLPAKESRLHWSKYRIMDDLRKLK